MRINATFSIAGHKYVTIGNAKIWESYSEKIFSIILDRDLKFKEHIEKMISKAGSKLTALARMSYISVFFIKDST